MLLPVLHQLEGQLHCQLENLGLVPNKRNISLSISPTECDTNTHNPTESRLGSYQCDLHYVHITTQHGGGSQPQLTSNSVSASHCTWATEPDVKASCARGQTGQLGGQPLLTPTALFSTTAVLVTHKIGSVSFSHLCLLPDVVVRAHQVAQQEVELLLLFRHCSEIQKDQPGGEAAK